MERLKLEQSGNVLVARLETPPANAPGAQARAALFDLVGRALPASRARALVILCSGDVAEPAARPLPADPAAEDGLAALCSALEMLEMPVIIGLRGDATGAGAELALAAHFRLAEENARLGWPDITRGGIAAGGGSQRLARIVGAERALELLLSGGPVGALEAVEIGLVDGVVQGDLQGAAVSLARRLLEAGAGPRRSRERSEGLADRAGFVSGVARIRKLWAPEPDSAEAHLVECVEAALVLPFETGLAFELAAAKEVNRSEAARALEHVFKAETAVLRSADATARPLRSVAIHGTTPQAADLGHGLLAAGYEIVLSDGDARRLRAGLSRIGARVAAALAAGLLDPAGRAAQLARLSSASAPGHCDLILYGSSAPRNATASGIVGFLREGTVTPQLTNAALDMGDACALFPASPENAAGILEILPGAQLSQESLVALLRLARHLGWQPVVTSRRATGAMAGRLTEALLLAAEHLLEDGATPRQIDSCLEAAGYAEGPFRMLDRAGLQTFLARRQAAAAGRDPRDRHVPVLERLAAAGRFGRAAGQGFYDYPEGIPEGVASGEVDALVRQLRADAGVVAREVSPEEIRRRCHLALVLEGVRLLEAGWAQRAADIDLVAIGGLGYPRRSGGPMYEAGQQGLSTLRDRLQLLAKTEDARFWTPPAYLDRLIAAGERPGA
ncbi:3-hydroxyacyl-CoA dehydrogenase family protein [Aliiruegeria lutimaris]|uniref:3-hydroxyacyl-CoA dehydrogenase n=1 Tax=Aliiruegeria lutimaris TaxID=571298 RepID=A0A1G8WP39_9RHOB|nr:3-hydroxyacyl-CoA dehydrogenase family protein [Aliiruegeria lutimaris]SDJ79921.1 3-hydroxyacyl-CoA dehydrogenase [Aliiruegeria lutimaris]